MLERSPKLVDPGDLLPGTNYAVDFAAPPRLSSLLLSRALIPAADGDDDDYLGGRVECADGEGNLLLSLCSGPAQGGRGLLVYLTGSVAKMVLPEVPENLVVNLRFGRDACLGITACPGPGFAVAQVHRRASSSSAPNSVLYFSSPISSWGVVDVESRFQANSDDEGYLAVEEEEAVDYSFEAHTAISHDAPSQIVFVDLKNRLLLLFTPGAAVTARFVRFPDGDGLPAADVEEAATRRVVASSEGRVFIVEVSSDRKCITMARLGEKDNWDPMFKVTAGEIFGSDTSIATGMVEAAAPGLELGPVYPTNSKRIILYVPGAGGLAFTAEVDGTQLSARFVHYDAPSRSCLDVVVWRFLNPDAGWIRKLAAKTAQMGARAVTACRENVHHLPPLACVVGGVLAQFSGGAPVAAAVVGGAGGLAALNNAVGAGEELGTNIRRWWSGGQKLNIRIIGNESEALQAINDWRELYEPPNMKVEAAPGMTQQRVDELRLFIRSHGAQALLPDDLSSYEMVSTAINF